jgi:hypothetical protein
MISWISSFVADDSRMMLDSDLKAVTVFPHRIRLVHLDHLNNNCLGYIKGFFTYLLFPPRNIFIINLVSDTKNTHSPVITSF